MSHLIEFRLTTKEKAEWKLEYLRDTLMVFGQLHILSLVVENWISDDDNQFPSGNQIEMIINEYIPHLRYFYCDIQTKCDVDMKVRVICQIYFSLNFFSFKTFVGLNRRWPMTYQIDPRSSSRYLYRVAKNVLLGGYSSNGK